jgi:hypothetical protein
MPVYKPTSLNKKSLRAFVFFGATPSHLHAFNNLQRIADYSQAEFSCLPEKLHVRKLLKFDCTFLKSTEKIKRYRPDCYNVLF